MGHLGYMRLGRLYSSIKRAPSASTERYQQSGYREDTYAEETKWYADYHGAIECMLRDCGFMVSTKNRSLAQWGMN
ncbi:MAG: hypothetical protein PHF57_12010 [Methanoregula sp.]|jgi:hypothetical protein|nr:hypothetical protein [Methanoregula sp.]